MILADRNDRSNVEALSTWLSLPRETGSGLTEGMGLGSLKSLTAPGGHGWGGYKLPGIDLWAGALNYADLGDVLARVREIRWTHPGAVQIFFRDEWQSYFRLWMYRDSEWTQYAPDPPADADEQHAW
jgi:hypothetical protein